jgi:acetyl esterase/lipase
MKKRNWQISWLLAVALGLISVARGQEAPAAAPAAPGVQAPLPAGVTLQKDIAYVPGGGASQSLDLYLPDAGGKAVPLVIFVHGGGWHSGSKDRCPAQFLAGHGYAVAGINYRLSPEAPFPAQIEDCRAALKFLRAGAAAYHIEPDHVCVWGGSAGGHLVALLGTAAGADFGTMPAKVAEVGKVDPSLQVQCVIDNYGPSDFTHLMGANAAKKDNSAVKLLGGFASEDELMAKAKWASPITYVRSDNAPFLIQHGDADKTVPIEQSKELTEALQKAGVEVTMVVMPGAGHAGAAFFTEENHKAVLEFLDKHLKTGK